MDMKKIILSISLFGFIFISINNAGAQAYVSGPEINNLPLCDSTYRLNCPYNVRCRNINGMIAFACPAAYANQPINNNYYNEYTSYVNNTNYTNNSNYYNNTSYINYNDTNHNNINYDIYARGKSRFVNNPVYFENGAYYTNPVQRPSYEISATYNQSNNYTHYSY